MKKNKFKVGDKVKLIGIKDEEEYIYKPHLGEIFTVSRVGSRIIDLKESSQLMPYYYNLEKVGSLLDYYNFRNAPIGTRITLRSGEYLVKGRPNIFENDHHYLQTGAISRESIIKIEEPEYKTIYEFIPDILDKDENKYLAQVIRPFRDKIKYIKKSEGSDWQELISIILDDYFTINLPLFKKNTMYKNMEVDKLYTLEDLNI